MDLIRRIVIDEEGFPFEFRPEACNFKNTYSGHEPLTFKGGEEISTPDTATFFTLVGDC